VTILCSSVMGKISKQRKREDTVRTHGVVGDLSSYETKEPRWILRFSFKLCLLNEIEIF
jgi:hypothetical protein